MGHASHSSSNNRNLGRYLLCFKLVTGLALIFAMTTAPAYAQRKFCPLTDAQSQKAIDAWAPIGSFLASEPRCVNCHGGVNPYVDGTGLDQTKDFDPAMPASILKHGGGLVLHEHNGSIDQGCKDCHDNMAPKADGSPSVNWTLAPSFLSFLNKDPTTLCIQIKRGILDASHFLGHLKNDNGGTNFADTAFLGTRGLDADQYLDKDSPVYIEPAPPSLSHDAVLKLAQKWLDAMGGKFQGDETCGCELKHSRWSGQIHYVVENKGDQGSNDLQNWVNYQFIKADVTVKDGYGAAQFAQDEHHVAENRKRKAVGGGATVIVPDNSTHYEASGGGMSVASVEVEINEAQKTYTVSPSWIPVVIGKSHSDVCGDKGCFPNPDQDISSPGMMQMSGELQDPNHVQGSSTNRMENIGRTHQGVRIETIRWDLWRTAN